MRFIRFNENNIYELNYQSLYILRRPDEPLNRLYAIVLGVRYVYFYEIVLIADFFFRCFTEFGNFLVHSRILEYSKSNGANKSSSFLSLHP